MRTSRILSASVLFSTVAILAACDSAPTPSALTSPVSTEFSSPVGEVVSQLPSVRVEDEGGRPLRNVEVQFVQTEGSGTISGAITRTDESGVATLESWVLGTTVGRYQVVATVNQRNVSPVPFNVNGVPGPPAALAMATQPPALVRNEAAMERKPQVRVTDRFGNPTRRENVVVNAALSPTVSSDVPAEMAATAPAAVPAAEETLHETAMTDADGVATFRNLQVAGRMGDRTLSFSSEGLTGTASEAFTLVPGDPDRLRLLEAPPEVVEAARPLDQPISVQLQDRFLNDVPKAGVEVEASLSSGAGRLERVENSVATSNDAGVAEFPDLVIRAGATGERTLSFGGPGLQTVETPPTLVQGRWPVRVAVNPAGAPKTSVQVDGETLAVAAPAGTVTVRDGEAFPVDIGGAALSDGHTLARWRWITFNEENTQFPGLENVTLNSAAESFILFSEWVDAGATATVPAEHAAGPVLLDVHYTPPPPASLTKLQGDRTGDNAGIKASEPVVVRPRVQLFTAQGAPAAGHRVRFTATAGGGAVTGADQLSGSDGIATVGGWAMGVTGGTNSLQVTLPDHPSVTPVTFTLQAATPTPTHLQIVGETNNQSGQAGTMLPKGPAVYVRGPGNVPVPGITVRFTVLTGGGSVTHSGLSESNELGGAGLGWTLGPTAGSNSVRATLPDYPTVAPVTLFATATAPPGGGGDSGGGDSGGGDSGGGSGGGDGGSIVVPPPPPPGPNSSSWTGNTIPVRIIEGAGMAGLPPVPVTITADGESRTFLRNSVGHGLTVNVPRGAQLTVTAHFTPNPAAGLGNLGFSALKMKAMNSLWGFTPDQVHHGNNGSWELYTNGSAHDQPPKPNWTWGGVLSTVCGKLGDGVANPYYTYSPPTWITNHNSIDFLVVWILEHQVPRFSC
ncbi:MAG: hypothetical protein WEA09_04095 [Gemmatimonadota bacterium]